mgnify:CR=1 FL=1
MWKFGEKKNIKIVYIILCIGIAFLCISSLFGEKNETHTAKTQIEYDNLEEKLEKALGNIQGVGKANVIVTYSASSESMLATDEEVDRSDGTERYSKKVVTVNTGSGQQPIIRGEKTPVIKGVVVICDGGASPVVQKNVTEAIEALTGVAPHNIGIFKRKE